MASAPGQDGSTVAVIIPTCDRPHLLPTALRSVLGQTRSPDEVVVADVGGRSWTAEAAALASGDGRVRHLELSAGLPAGAARNRGAAVARSEWLAFLDDDDLWDPAYLKAALALAAPGVEAIATRLRLRRNNATLVFPPLPTGLRARDVLIRNPGITGSNLVIRTSAFERVGGYDEQLAAYNDLDFLIRALDAGVALCVNQAVAVEQRIHPDGQATNASLRRLDALSVYSKRYHSRMSIGQRITARRDRYRLQKHLDRRPASKVRHWAGDLLLTSPREHFIRIRRRITLRGGYD